MLLCEAAHRCEARAFDLRLLLHLAPGVGVGTAGLGVVTGAGCEGGSAGGTLGAFSPFSGARVGTRSAGEASRPAGPPAAPSAPPRAEAARRSASRTRLAFRTRSTRSFSSAGRAARSAARSKYFFPSTQV